MKEFLAKKKNALLIALIFVIVAGVYNLILFLSAKDDALTSGFWTAYAFMWAAFLGVIGSFLFVAADIKGAKISVSWINILIAFIYLGLELITSIIIMAVKTEEYIPCLIVQILLFAGFVVAFIIFAVARNYNAQHIEDNQRSVGYIKKVSALLNICYNAEKDYDRKEVLRKLYDLVRTSSPMSEGLDEIESLILDEAETLKDMVVHGETDNILPQAEKIRTLMLERNSML